MVSKRVIKILLAALAAILVLLIAVGLTYTVYENTHIFIEDKVYPADAEKLDLRQEPISREHYDLLQESLPDCEILWMVPFQGQSLSSDTRELKLTELSPHDLETLDYFRDLERIDGRDCDSFDLLVQLEQRRPDCEVLYLVPLAGEKLERSCRELTLSGGEASYEELLQKLPLLPQLQSVRFSEPELEAEQLLQLRSRFPDLEITWEKTLFGALLQDDIQELDISGMKDTGLDEVAAQTAYLPGLQKLIMNDFDFSNEEMAEFRDRMREHYKVVWTVRVGTMWVRTDETWFMPTKFGAYVNDRTIDNLYYCEDMICVDVGHHPVKHVDWVAGMPHLRYLVVADCPLRDVTPLAQLKEVVWLELFMTDIRDITPLLEMTGLEDLNLARIPADLKPISEMKWLNNLWISGGYVPRTTVSYLRENMPDTYIDASGHHNCCGRGWRQLQNYYDMRDILGMPYFGA